MVPSYQIATEMAKPSGRRSSSCAQDPGTTGSETAFRRSCWAISTVFGVPLSGKHPDWFPGVLIWFWCENTEATMNSVIYLVGLIVVVLLILSFFGLR